MTFFIVPPKQPPRPIPLYKFINTAIWKVQCIAVAALAIEGPPSIYTDFLLKTLVDALRTAADQIEQAMELRAAERRAEHQRQLEARQTGR
ncbi:hypothetical protein [Bradyrhizobium sp. Leo121]|uniref:hypothetical protein n=1 Tax=Bradyrhizobium sp. Leo121 TaxID=1571195 RepID=UPI001029242C|nr:hypothetical protein [Bradyrhizobium sp. Leo121]